MAKLTTVKTDWEFRWRGFFVHCATLVCVALVAHAWPFAGGAACVTVSGLLWMAAASGILQRWRFAARPLTVPIYLVQVLGLLAAVAVASYGLTLLVSQPRWWIAVPLMALVLVPAFRETAKMSCSSWSEVPTDDGKPVLLPGRFASSLPFHSVVRILTAERAGNGVVVHRNGTIATAFHVVKDATNIRVVLKNGDLRVARLLAGDEENDVALIKIDVEYPLRSPSLLSSLALTVGDERRILGYEPVDGVSFQIYEPMLITAIDAGTRPKPLRFGFATSATLRPGFSGSAAVSKDGAVLGIVSWGRDDSGVCGIVPIVFVQRLAKRHGILLRSNHTWWRSPRLERKNDCMPDGWALVTCMAYHSIFVDRTKHDVDRWTRMIARIAPSQITLPEAALVEAEYHSIKGDKAPERAAAIRAVELGIDLDVSEHLTPSDDEQRLQNLRLYRVQLARIADGGRLAPSRRTDLRVAIASTLRDLGRHDECLLTCQEGLSDANASGKTFRLWFVRGECLERLGRDGEAVAAFTQALSAPDRRDVRERNWQAYIRSLGKVGTWESCWKAMTFVVERLGTVSPETLQEAIGIAERLGDPDVLSLLKAHAKTRSPGAGPFGWGQPPETFLKLAADAQPASLRRLQHREQHDERGLGDDAVG